MIFFIIIIYVFTQLIPELSKCLYNIVYDETNKQIVYF
jgi:hypothetical protein